MPPARLRQMNDASTERLNGSSFTPLSTDQRGITIALPCGSVLGCTFLQESVQAFPQRASSLQAIAPIAAKSLPNSYMTMHVHITCIRTLHTLRYLPSAGFLRPAIYVL